MSKAHLTHRGSSVFRSLTTTGQALRRQLWLWPLLAAILLSFLGKWLISTIEQTVQDDLASGLQSISRAETKALEIWLESQKDNARTVAGNPAVRDSIVQLANAASNAKMDLAAYLQQASLKTLDTHLRPLLDANEYPGYLVIAPNGKILAADRQEYIWTEMAGAGTDAFEKALHGTATVTRPFKSTFLHEVNGKKIANMPTMLALAPVTNNENDTIAVLGLRIRPEKEFSQILRIVKLGDSGDSFAFDRSGRLLSQSRFDPELRRIGLLPFNEESQSILSLDIRDPGGDLTNAFRLDKNPNELPLTRMAQSATAGESGVDVHGYRDFRGVPVIGAWEWLPEYEMGVAVEMSVEEAYRPLYLLRQVFWVLFGLLILAAIAIFVIMIIMDRYRLKMRKAVLEAQQLGQYQLQEKLGSGGMGVVYKARHAMLRRPTAIKLLEPEKTTEDTIARFEREVQLTSQLNHPNTIAIYDYGRTPEGVFYYAMEYLDGISLDHLVEMFGAQPEGRVIHILQQVCGSLAEAHELGVIHRDIKPANIMLNKRGGMYDVVKVLDFGLVKAVDSRKQATLTAVGAITGTPHYLSPEGIDNPQQVDARSDIYALGAVGYFILTGTPVFRGDTLLEIIRAQVESEPAPPSERLGRSISADLEQVLLRCLAKKKSDRPQSVRELAEELARCRLATSWDQQQAQSWWEKREEFRKTLDNQAAANATVEFDSRQYSARTKD